MRMITTIQFEIETLFINIILYNILTSTKNASLIITDFLAMVYKNEQSRNASLYRGWAMLENDFNLKRR